MSLEIQQKLVVTQGIGEGDPSNEVQSETAITIDSDVESTGDEEKFTKIPHRAVFLVLLFNVFLILSAIPAYLYFRTENELLKKRVLDFLIVGGAIVGIPVLYSMGDISKERPNFYYI